MVDIRKNIQNLSNEENERFSLAWETLIKNKTNRRESSLLFEIARLHGYRDDHCLHNTPLFLYWHRLYLLEFEEKLSEADRENGYDGNIKLPYWNWIENKKLPDICNRYDSIPRRLLRRRVRMNRQYRRISRLLRSSNLESDINIILSSNRYSRIYYNGRGNDLESIHDRIHTAIGRPMNGINYAAFTIEFWLHHCFVDLLLESYIRFHEKKGISVHNRYKRLMRRNRNFQENFYPFRKKNGTIYSYDDDIPKSEYDNLIEIEQFNMIEKPIYCIIPGLKKTDFVNNSYTIMCFCFKNKEELKNFNKKDTLDNLLKHKHFGGIGSIFNMRNNFCKNCKKNNDFDLYINIAKCIKNINSNKYDVIIDFVILDSNFKITNNIFDKYFVKSEELCCDNIDYHTNKECKQIKEIQKHLKKIGYYNNNITGVIDDNTISSIKQLKEYFKINSGGEIDHNTRCLLNKKRYDYESDILKSNINIKKGSLKFCLHNYPISFGKKTMINILRISLHFWETITNEKYVITSNLSDTDIIITFNEIDGQGNILGKIKKNVVIIDDEEIWNLKERNDSGYNLLQVLIHEIGHVLNFPHINNPECIMYPYYTNIKLFNPENIKTLKNIIN